MLAEKSGKQSYSSADAFDLWDVRGLAANGGEARSDENGTLIYTPPASDPTAALQLQVQSLGVPVTQITLVVTIDDLNATLR